MNKMILSFALISAVTFGASAQKAAKTQAAPCKPAQECCVTEEVCVGQVCPFQGISNLTDDQKAKLKALKGECAQKAKADKAETKKAQKAQKAECAKKRQESRKANLAKIKEILTPEQYVEFLEIQYITPNQGPKASVNKGGKKGKGKDGKSCDGQKCNKEGKKDGKKSEKK